METATFTNEEQAIINRIYANGIFEGLTSDEVQLVARWESYLATMEERHRTEIEAIITECNTSIENANIEHKAAMDNLNRLASIALEGYEMLRSNV